VVVTELGFRLGRRVYTRGRAEETERSGVGFVTGGTLGLLAFLLGVTLSLADGRHNERRGVVLAEARCAR